MRELDRLIKFAWRSIASAREPHFNVDEERTTKEMKNTHARYKKEERKELKGIYKRL